MSQEIIITLAITSLIALVVGFFIGRNIGGSTDNSKALTDAQKELADYKAHVSEHFGKTADLVDNLTQSYKDVFDHLGNSAKSLLSEEQVKQHLTSRASKAITLTYIADEAKAANPMQTAQTEIQAQTTVDKATEDAKKMAAEIQKTAETDTTKETLKKTSSQTALDKAAEAVKTASKEKTS